MRRYAQTIFQLEEYIANKGESEGGREGGREGGKGSSEGLGACGGGVVARFCRLFFLTQFVKRCVRICETGRETDYVSLKESVMGMAQQLNKINMEDMMKAATNLSSAPLSNTQQFNGGGF